MPLVLVTALLQAGCTQDMKPAPAGQGAGTTTRGPAATTVPVTATVPSLQYHQFGTPTVVRPGHAVGISPDGSHVYVEIRDASRTSQQCLDLKSLSTFLYRVPVGGGVGEEITAAGGDDPVFGQVLHGPGGRVAIWRPRPTDESAPCSYHVGLWLGMESPDGRINDLRRVQSPELDSLVEMGWNSDGSRLVTFRVPTRARIGLDPVPILLFDPATASTSKLFDATTRVVGHLTPVAGGLYALAEQDADNRNVVRLRDGTGTVKAEIEATSFTVSPSGAQIAVDSGNAIAVMKVASPTPVTIVPARSGAVLSPASFSYDDQALAFTSFASQSSSIEVVTFADRKVSKVPASVSVVSPQFTPDGRALIYARVDGTEPTTVAVRLGT